LVPKYWFSYQILQNPSAVQTNAVRSQIPTKYLSIISTTTIFPLSLPSFASNLQQWNKYQLSSDNLPTLSIKTDNFDWHLDVYASNFHQTLWIITSIWQKKKILYLFLMSLHHQYRSKLKLYYQRADLNCTWWFNEIELFYKGMK